MKAYRNPAREICPIGPIEVFHLVDGEMFVDGEHDALEIQPEFLEAGWYWWTCFPGCLPDSEPPVHFIPAVGCHNPTVYHFLNGAGIYPAAFGPFDTEAEALEDARNY